MRALAHPLAASFVAGLLLLPACDKDDNKPDDKTAAHKADDANQADEVKAVPPQPQPQPQAAVLTIGAAKIVEKDKPEQGIELGADGIVSVNGDEVGSVAPDGKLRSAEGKIMMTVTTEGRVTVGDKPIPLTLVEGGVNLEGPEGKVVEIRFAEDGAVAMALKNADGSEAEPPGDEPPPEMTAEGCTGETAKACGLVFAAYMLMGPDEAVEGPDSAPAEP